MSDRLTNWPRQDNDKNKVNHSNSKKRENDYLAFNFVDYSNRHRKLLI